MREKILQIERELNELAAERGEAIHTMIRNCITSAITGHTGEQSHL